MLCWVFFVKQKTAYEMRISDWSSDVCSSDLEQPARDELHARLASVLEVVYLIFNEGYSATAGDNWMRPSLCDEALRLGRIVAGLMPQEAEVHGLLALMEIQASRAAARIADHGEPVLVPQQHPAHGDQRMI